MAGLAAAFGSSHSVMLTSTVEDWQRGFVDRDQGLPFYDRAGKRCSYADLLAAAPDSAGQLIRPEIIAERHANAQSDIKRMKAAIEAARLDALIVCGDDQHELFDEIHMPSIGVYWGATIRNGAREETEDWYERAQMRRLEDAGWREYPCDQALALQLIEGLMSRGFDLTALSGLRPAQHEGHAFSFPHRMYLGDRPVPIVPVFVNTFYPPNQPSPARCVALGAAIREVVAALPPGKRVGLLASGGLSHFAVEEDLDLAVIQALQAKNTAALAALDPRRLQSGSSEILNWIVLGGAVGSDLDLDWVSYTPAYRTPALTGTGLCFAAWK